MARRRRSSFLIVDLETRTIEIVNHGRVDVYRLHRCGGRREHPPNRWPDPALPWRELPIRGLSRRPTRTLGQSAAQPFPARLLPWFGKCSGQFDYGRPCKYRAFAFPHRWLQADLCTVWICYAGPADAFRPS
jgi:hypothetical protein